MVLIISEIDDYSTNEVIDWLRFYKMNFVRISRNDKINFHKILLSNYNNDIEFYINNDKFKLSDFKAFWYRRSHMIFSFEEIVGNNSLIKQINAHLSTEAKELGDYFKSYISERSINKYDDIYFNKLKTLKIASEVGLVIPKSIVTKCKNELIKFRDESKNVITKNFSQGVFIFKKNHALHSPTQIVTNEILDSIPDNFAYSLFQEEIEKHFELRIFFLNSEFYASAIFSQNDPMTKVDFRNYNFKNPNRTPPFELPSDLKIKLLKLMKKVDLNCGSIDMIFSKKNEFVFLEINPIGQFGQVSKPCNYNIEELIAKKLIKIVKKNTNGN